MDGNQRHQLMQKMAGTAEVIAGLVRDVAEPQARWKPDAQSWSILEVINHLYDEEKEDFRIRLDFVLHRPNQPWPKTDPPGWVLARHYNDRELKESLDNFLAERRASLQWLQALSDPDWGAVYEAPFGPIRAGDIFAAWAAHDLLHLRQLVELHFAYTQQLVQPYQVDYAGPW